MIKNFFALVGFWVVVAATQRLLETQRDYTQGG
jgi:hypothetical protein